MMTANLPLNQINHQAIQVLCREIGVVNTLRFIQQFTNGFGNFTLEREKNQEGATVESIVEEIKNIRKK